MKSDNDFTLSFCSVTVMIAENVESFGFLFTSCCLLKYFLVSLHSIAALFVITGLFTLLLFPSVYSRKEELFWINLFSFSAALPKILNDILFKHTQT